MTPDPAKTFLAIDAALETLGDSAVQQPGETLAQAVVRAARRREDGLPPLPKPHPAVRDAEAGEWIGGGNLKV